MNLKTQIRVQEIQIEDAQEALIEIEEFISSGDEESQEELNQAYEAKEQCYNEIAVCKEVLATLKAQLEA